MASATVSFGMVAIPVKLYPSTRSEAALRFNMLHACGSRLKQQSWCPKCEKVVPREEIVKGYEIAKDQYVTFAPEELKALEEEASRVIEIREFVPLEGIDPRYFDRTYYLGPDKGGDKPYRLLAQAMRKTGLAALASWAARGKQYLVLLRPYEDGLSLEQLHYADEFRAFDEIEIGEAEVKAAELDLAVKLIEQIASEDFEPDKYRDEVRDRIEAAIAKKAEGEQLVLAPAAEPRAQIIDLMEALKSSLEAGAPAAKRGARKGPQPARRAKKPARVTKGSRSRKAAKK